MNKKSDLYGYHLNYKPQKFNRYIDISQLICVSVIKKIETRRDYPHASWRYEFSLLYPGYAMDISISTDDHPRADMLMVKFYKKLMRRQRWKRLFRIIRLPRLFYIN